MAIKLPADVIILFEENECPKCGRLPRELAHDFGAPDFKFACKCGHKWRAPRKKVLEVLKERRYEIKGAQIGRLVDRKQREYGDSWGAAADILRVLFPNGIKPEQYHVVLGIARVIDKLKRIANGNKGEEDAWLDIAGYGLLGSMDGERR